MFIVYCYFSEIIFQIGLQTPDHKLFELHPTINNDLLNQLKLGTVKPHKDIKLFRKDSVEFIDGTVVPIDVVVFATGILVFRFCFLICVCLCCRV